jgi:hypothetical protein
LFGCSHHFYLTILRAGRLVPFLDAGKHWFIALQGLIFPFLFLWIDYILANKKFRVQQFGKIEVDYSNHYAIMEGLELAQ